jgi:hypothetical protein
VEIRVEIRSRLEFGFDEFGFDEFGSDEFGSDEFGSDEFGSDEFGLVVLVYWPEPGQKVKNGQEV